MSLSYYIGATDMESLESATAVISLGEDMDIQFPNGDSLLQTAAMLVVAAAELNYANKHGLAAQQAKSEIDAVGDELTLEDILNATNEETEPARHQIVLDAIANICALLEDETNPI